MPRSLSKINNPLCLSVMTFVTLSKLADADVLGRMSKEETYCFLSWPFKWLHHFCNTLSAFYPACKFPSIFPWTFLEAEIEQLGRDGPELPISAFPFLSCPKTEWGGNKNKMKEPQIFIWKITLSATQICEGILKPRGFLTANQQDITKTAALGNR